MGVRNHIGKIIRSNTNRTITPAEAFLELMYLLIKSNTGVKINAKIKAITIEIKMGFRTRMDIVTKRPTRTTVAVF